LRKYNRYLIDEIGNTYERKNQFLLDIAVLQHEMDTASKEEKKALEKQVQALKKNKKDHPYYKAYKAYQEEKNLFWKKLKEESRSFEKNLDKELSPSLKRYKVKEFEAEKKEGFFKNYLNLNYEATYYHEEAKLERKYYPELIFTYIEKEKKLADAKEQRQKLSAEEEAQAKVRFNEYKQEEKQELKSSIASLKKKRKDKLISDKALKIGKKELKFRYNKALTLKRLESPKKANRELIRTLRHEMKERPKQLKKTLNADIADKRRKIPIEVEKTKPVIAYSTFFLPGMGQLLNKQFVKAGLFLVASFFIYFAAIPYALGYGNYQGDGIAGLITLAEGAPRVYTSMMFLIEGILAIFLILIAGALYWISLRDIKAVEEKAIVGIRPKNWFETLENIKHEGFPYMVSFPALFVIIFIVVVPVITTLMLSFTNMNPQNQSKFSWIGIDNYRLLVMGQGLAGSVFWQILGWTLIWTLVATTFAILIGFVLALITNHERIVGKKIFRTIYLLPWAVPAFITILFFSIMFSPNGALTDIISNIFGERIIVKHSTNLTRLTLIGLQGWLGSAYVFLLTTGVLQAIPSDLYEAAEIDGATIWQKTRRITIPIVLFQTAPLLITQYTFNFNNFSIIYLFHGGGPFNPSRYGNLAGGTDILVSYIYKLTMVNQYQAISAAIILFVSLGVMFFAYLGFRNSKAFKEERL
jgi:arabinogalactan oligomer / maltooligosaccharide transport system permease protein